MQQALLDRADAVMSSISGAVSKASDLAVEGGKAVADQVPEVAMQYVMYGRAVSTVTEVLALFGLWFFGYKMFSQWGLINTKNFEGESFERIIFVVAGGAGGVVSFMIAVGNLKELLMVWFAPKVWLLLELVNLVKSVHHG
jgi:hypothetical protein